ncbi:MAG: putative lipoprotein [Myxococcota bacterium]
MRAILVATAVLSSLALASTGCISKSSTSQASSESSSDSSRSSSRGSSQSSKSSASSSRSSTDAAYVGDVRDATEEHVLGGRDPQVFKSELAKLAEDNGITDWQSDKHTYEGIGRGLKRSRVRGDRFEELKEDLGEHDTQYMSWIQAGYKAERAP